jgi:hypothetical protein
MKRLAPMAVVLALMAVPSLAAADPTYWGESDDYEPIGGAMSEDPVTVDFSGTIEIDNHTGFANSVDCEVTGQAVLANDWDNPAGTPATQRIVSLQPAGTVANSCTGTYYGFPPSSISYNAPWAGSVSYAPYAGYQGVFNDVLIEMEWHGGHFQTYAEGDLETLPLNDMYDCVIGLQIDGATLNGFYHMSTVNGVLEFDLETLEGINTEEACLVLG